MSVCKLCGANIPRGKIYKGEKYKSIPFCSQECYDKYVASKQKQSKQTPQKDKWLEYLKDYINNLWDGKVNWPFIMKQVKSLREEYELTNKDLYLTMKYAVEYDNYIVKPEYGLGQFVKFIIPSQEFAEDIKRNKELAENLPEEVVIVKKPCNCRRFIREEEWD